MVPDHHDLVGMELCLYSIEGGLEVLERAGLGEISCLDEEVAIRKWWLVVVSRRSSVEVV